MYEYQSELAYCHQQYDLAVEAEDANLAEFWANKFNDLLDEEDRYAKEQERLWNLQLDGMMADVWR